MSEEKNDTLTETPGSKDQRSAVEKATSTPELTPAEVQSGTDWFLSDELPRPSVLFFDLNVAGAGQPAHRIRYGIRSLTRSEIKDIRKSATDENTGILDDMESNLRVVIGGSYDPNLVDIAKQKNMADPGDLVLQRFGHRPGIIDQIANRINRLSGYGDSEIIKEIDAAGN